MEGDGTDDDGTPGGSDMDMDESFLGLFFCGPALATSDSDH
jgi:hypothetical protein